MNDTIIDLVKSGPPLPIRTAHLLSNVGRLQSKRFTEGLVGVGLRAKEFALLNQIALAEGSSQKELGGRLGLDPSGLVATIDGLQRRELVERKPDPDDRRRYALHLTDHGRTKLDEGRALARRLADLLLDPLDENEVARLHDLLARVEAAAGT